MSKITPPAENLVQPVLVLKTASHAETVKAAALASLGAQLTNPHAAARFTPWLQQAFTKTVRRVDEKGFLKALAWAEENHAAHAVRAVEDAKAIGFAPMTYDEFPAPLKRAQVSGTDFSQNELAPVFHPRPVELVVLSTLSTGKASAQAAHGLWKWYLTSSADRRAQWVADGQPVNITLEDAAKLATTVNHHDSLRVIDNGLTEVEAKTFTCYAYDPGYSF